MTDESNLPADAPWWARWLVAEWRQCYKWFSVQLLAFLAVAPEIYDTAPQLQQVVPPTYWHHLQAFIAVVAILGRLAKQNSVQQSNIMKRIEP